MILIHTHLFIPSPLFYSKENEEKMHAVMQIVYTPQLSLNPHAFLALPTITSFPISICIKSPLKFIKILVKT